MTSYPVTSHFAALLAFMFIALSVNVIRQRRKNLIAIGDGAVAPLQYAIRAHGNFIEYTPFFLLLLWLVESQALLSSGLLMAIGSLFIASRLSHAHSLLNVEPAAKQMDVRFRVLGMAGSFTAIGLLALCLLF